MIFFTITCRTTLWRSLFLQILQVGTKIEIHHRLFCGDNFTSKNFNKLFLVDSLLACTKLRIHEGILKYLGRNFCKIVRKTYVVPFRLCEWTLQPTTDTFWKCSKRKGYSKISKIPKKSLRHYLFSPNAAVLQSWISVFSKYRFQEKCFIWLFWSNCKFARERSIMKLFD